MTPDVYLPQGFPSVLRRETRDCAVLGVTGQGDGREAVSKLRVALASFGRSENYKFVALATEHRALILAIFNYSLNHAGFIHTSVINHRALVGAGEISFPLRQKPVIAVGSCGLEMLGLDDDAAGRFARDVLRGHLGHWINFGTGVPSNL